MGSKGLLSLLRCHWLAAAVRDEHAFRHGSGAAQTLRFLATLLEFRANGAGVSEAMETDHQHISKKQDEEQLEISLDASRHDATKDVNEGRTLIFRDEHV